MHVGRRYHGCSVENVVSRRCSCFEAQDHAPPQDCYQPAIKSKYIKRLLNATNALPIDVEKERPSEPNSFNAERVILLAKASLDRVEHLSIQRGHNPQWGTECNGNGGYVQPVKLNIPIVSE